MTRKFGIGSGTISLVVIFSVLCLVIFALLTLATARADLNLSTKNAESRQKYYAADAKAAEILAQILDSDIMPEEIDGTAIHEFGDDINYSVEIDDVMSIYVEYSMFEGEIKSWRTAQTKEWVPNENIDVFTGDIFDLIFGN